MWDDGEVAEAAEGLEKEEFQFREGTLSILRGKHRTYITVELRGDLTFERSYDSGNKAELMIKTPLPETSSTN